MKVSIITVVFNGADTIRDCIESVLSQTYPQVEYIVVDGQSTDGTVELVRSFGDRITRFISEPDKGLYDAMNKGIGLATGDVIGILNADDLYKDDQVITDIVQTMQQTNSDAAYGDLVYVDQQNLDRVTRYWRAGKYREGAFLWGWMPPHPTFFVRRWVYEQYGLFTLRFRSAADYELMLRFVHKYKIKISYLARTLIMMRTGGVSNRTLDNRLNANQEDREAWKMNGLRPYFFSLWLKPLLKVKQFIIKQ